MSRPANDHPREEKKDNDLRTEWDLTNIFSSRESWAEEYQALLTAVDKLSSFKGLHKKKAPDLYSSLQAIDALKNRVEILYVYAHMKFDRDSRKPENQALNSQAMDLMTRFSTGLSFLEPELSRIDQEQWKALEADYEPLSLYGEYHRQLIALKGHILSDREESLLSRAAPLLNNSAQVFNLLNHADFTFPAVHNDQGEMVELTHARYQSLLQSGDPAIRREAFEGYYSVYKQFNNSLAGTLSAAIRRNNFLAEVRHYDSARQKSLQENQIPEAVYENLVDTVRDRIVLLHRYTALRKQLLDLKEMRCSDLYAPMVMRVSLEPDYRAGQELVLDALKPMGEDYLKIVEKAFKEGWIDVYEHKGKRSGAYSGGTYGTNPFILLNWQNQLNSVYTLIHELGHSLHSYYARSSQPYIYSDYPIFLAEIASTTNENLLTDYFLKQTDDPDIRAYILAYYLDGFKATVFRQTQFAEFEHALHEADREGRPLTADYLNTVYKDLNDAYYGPALSDDPLIAYEWSRVPHFYYNYYVYQYATGFSAATAFAQTIKDSSVGIEAYLTFLKSGSSIPPIDVLKEAGLDMTGPEPVNQALDVFAAHLTELEAYAENKLNSRL